MILSAYFNKYELLGPSDHIIDTRIKFIIIS